MAAKGGREEGTTWLLLKHFPKWLTAVDKESLLTHFGATQVVVMPTRGRMKNCVFAEFSSPTDSTQAMGKLHQLEVFGSRLVVEYAHSAQHKLMLEAKKDKWACNTSSKLVCVNTEPEEGDAKPKAKKERTKSPSPEARSGVRYLYPPATPTTITNITSALMCVPEFYQQVLHLMNLMNLPPPFGALTPIPPPIHMPLQGDGEGGEEEREESSELESDEEERERRKKRTRSPVLPHAVKRRKISYQQVKTLQTSLKKSSSSVEEQQLTPSTSRGRIELKVPSELVAHSEEGSTTISYIEPVSSKEPSTSTVALPTAATPSISTTPTENSQPPPCPSQNEEEGVAFITSSELRLNRLTSADMQDSHVYKNYSPGEVSTRLYIKNLAKQVEEKDLRYIFGRYVDWNVEEQKNVFDIRLMQTGRMKGQAFIGLPEEGVASQALRETNGYVLHGKPMVVDFARSSKPKD